MENKLYHLIFVDDDKDFLHSMNMTLSSRELGKTEGIDVETHYLSDPDEVIAFLRELTEEQEKIAVIISDQQMPKLSGIELLEKVREIQPNIMKMLLTGHASLDSAKYAINNQILDQYVSKPIEDYDNFISLINNAIKTYHFREAKEQAEEEVRQYVHELELRNARIKSMHIAAEKIAYLAQGFRKLDIDEVFDLIISRLPVIFNAKYGSLFLLNEEERTLKMVRSNYLDEVYEKKLDIDDKSPMMVALRKNKTIVLPEIQQASFDFLHKDCLGSSCIIIPFILGGDENAPDILGSSEGIRGVLNLGNITEMETEEIVEYAASLIRNILGINILNARLYQKTQKLALTDGLTGLYNKHIFLEFLKKECDYSERHGLPFYLALFDADNFKTVNDTHGHRVGDEVLKQLGVMLKRAARTSDIVARFGGEEFSWIIHRGDIKDIIAVIERFRQDVENCVFPESVRMSISIGMSRFCPRTGDTMEKLIDRADKAMYQSKTSGKNRVEVSIIDAHN